MATTKHHARRLRLAADLLDSLERDPLGRDFPATAMTFLATLTHSDEVSQVRVAPSTRVLADRLCYTVPHPPELDQAQIDQLFWPAFFQTLVCRYPHLPGGLARVLGATDLMSERQFTRSLTGELFRLQGVRHNLIVPLRLVGDVEDRLELFRFDGKPFDEDDKVFLQLLKPHLALRLARQQAVGAGIRSESAGGALTARQQQVMTLVGDGLSNREIAEQLVLAEGTVNRHLENIYARLGVRRRSAAVAALRQHLQNQAHW